MRIIGVESFERRGTHRLLTNAGKVVELQIVATSATLTMHVARTLPEPQPRMLTRMDKQGKPDGPPVAQRDEPEYQNRYQNWIVDRAAAIAYHGLRLETGIEWDVGPVGNAPDLATYASVRAEMEGIGFTGEEMIRLAGAVRELASVTEETLEQASKDFSQGQAAANSA